VKLTEKLNEEIKHFKKLQAMFLGKENKPKIQDIDLRDYMKFVLKEGSILEKRSVLESLSGEINIHNRKLDLV